VIPIWLLNALHYISLAAALTMLALLGWHYLRRRGKD